MGRCPHCRKEIDYAVAVEHNRTFYTLTLEDETDPDNPQINWSTDDTETDETYFTCPKCGRDIGGESDVIDALTYDDNGVSEYVEGKPR